MFSGEVLSGLGRAQKDLLEVQERHPIPILPVQHRCDEEIRALATP